MSEITDHLGNKVVNSNMFGISWVDLRIVIDEKKRNSQFWVGICHFSDRVFFWTPLDFEKPTLVTSINVSLSEGYCEKAFECVNFSCRLNKFSRDAFMYVFEGLGRETLGLPQDFGPGGKDLWFNDPHSKWYPFWGKLLAIFSMKPEGGKMGFSRKALDMYRAGKTRLVEEVTDPAIVKKIEEDNKELSRTRDWESEVV